MRVVGRGPSGCQTDRARRPASCGLGVPRRQQSAHGQGSGAVQKARARLASLPRPLCVGLRWPSCASSLEVPRRPTPGAATHNGCQRPQRLPTASPAWQPRPPAKPRRMKSDSLVQRATSTGSPCLNSTPGHMRPGSSCAKMRCTDAACCTGSRASSTTSVRSRTSLGSAYSTLRRGGGGRQAPRSHACGDLKASCTAWGWHAAEPCLAGGQGTSPACTGCSGCRAAKPL